MNTKEYAGTDLQEIRDFYLNNNNIRYTKIVEDNGKEGFTLSAPNGDYTEEQAAAEGRLIYVVVWPCKEGGYWAEEY